MNSQNPSQSPNPLSSRASRIISTVLSPALRVWLKSQVSQIEDLQVKIEGRDRQILTGHIPQVLISAREAVYQGLHLSYIQLVGTNIRVNLGQVLKGKPLRLLEPIPVAGQLLQAERDLQASLQSPLLSQALTELLGTLLAAAGQVDSTQALKDGKISWEKITLDADQLEISGVLADLHANTTPIVLRTGLQLASSHELQLTHLNIQAQDKLSPVSLESFLVDLGSEVDLQELTLTPGKLICRGNIRVIPIADNS